MSELFRIADQEFSVVSSRLEAFVARDRLCWGFVIQARSDDPNFERWEPQVSSDIFVETKSTTLSSWHDLPPVKTAWTDKNDTDTCPSAYLYVFEHTPIYECSLELRTDSGQPRLSLSGKCDVNYSQDYFDTGLDLEIDVATSFYGILCGKRSKSEAEALVKPYLSLSELAYTQDSAGVGLMVPSS